MKLKNSPRLPSLGRIATVAICLCFARAQARSQATPQAAYRSAGVPTIAFSAAPVTQSLPLTTPRITIAPAPIPTFAAPVPAFAAPVSAFAAPVSAFAAPHVPNKFRPAILESHTQTSLVEQWKRSLEYGVLLKQNRWQGWSDSGSSSTPEIEWMESHVDPESEYSRLCRQTFSLGWDAVEAAARSQAGELAVIVDIDETVLVNSRFQRENYGNPSDPAAWEAWIKRMEAGAVPGAKDFLDKVRGLGPRVHVVFMSDRPEEMNAYTIENLRRQGMFSNGDIVLSRTEAADSKEHRRRCLSSGSTGTDPRCTNWEPMTIIAKFGDSLRDHFEIHDRGAAMEMLDDPRWGKEDFILPNPMYGQWIKDYK
ncbi:MAG: HAD family acid phosphatase [Elusimicrobiota bacterium]